MSHSKQPETLLEHYRTVVVPELQKALGRKNVLSLPRPLSVTLNVGLGRSKDDPRLIDVARSTLARVSGQKPVLTKARKAISAFKIREGMVVGAAVTLRGRKMWDLLTKLTTIVLPRVRDFHGLTRRSIDRQGNMTVGFKEHLVFPEIAADEVEQIHGVELSISTTARTSEEAYQLLRGLGLPFRD